MKLFCFLFGHQWSNWQRGINAQRDDRRCLRCGKMDYCRRVG